MKKSIRKIIWDSLDIFEPAAKFFRKHPFIPLISVLSLFVLSKITSFIFNMF